MASVPWGRHHMVRRCTLAPPQHCHLPLAAYRWRFPLDRRLRSAALPTFNKGRANSRTCAAARSTTRKGCLMRRAWLGILPACLLAAVAVRAQEDDDGSAPHLDGQVTDLISRIDPARIQDRIEFLGTFGTRNSCSTPDNNPNLTPNQGILASQNFIFAQFAAIKGMKVAFAPLVHGNCPNSPTRNVVAWLPGKRHPERLIVIGGHLDSRSFNVLDVNADTSAQLAAAGAPNAHVLVNAPAGNDAAAQTTVVLEAAAALAGGQFDDTLVFISFSGEEQGLFGSADIAKNAGAAIAAPSRLAEVTGIKGAKVVAMLNNDISGGDNVANTGG